MEHIPIHKGEPIDHEYFDFYWGKDGLGEYFQEYLDAQKEEVKFGNINTDVSAVDFLIDKTKQMPGEITLICLAPLTNIRKAIEKDPEFVNRVRNVVILGGTYLGIGNAPNWCSEFNFYKDPGSASVVLSKFKDITIVPIEVCYDHRKLDQEFVIKAFHS